VAGDRQRHRRQIDGNHPFTWHRCTHPCHPLRTWHIEDPRHGGFDTAARWIRSLEPSVAHPPKSVCGRGSLRRAEHVERVRCRRIPERSVTPILGASGCCCGRATRRCDTTNGRVGEARHGSRRVRFDRDVSRGHSRPIPLHPKMARFSARAPSRLVSDGVTRLSPSTRAPRS
jgi:hypothetical protein